MRRFTAILAAALLGTALSAAEPVRPAITGISHLAVYTADAAASEDYYVRILGARKALDPEDAHGVRYYFSPQQFVEVLPLGPNPGLSRMAHVGWNTKDAASLRAYLIARKYPGISALQHAPDGALWFSTQDPEGNEVQFVQPATTDAAPEPGAISGRIIHIGYMVRPPPPTRHPSRARSAGASSISAIWSATARPRMPSIAICSASGLTGMAR